MSRFEPDLFVKFETRAIKDHRASRDEGRDIYKDVPFVTIQVKGQDKQVVCRKAKDEDKRRFPDEWDAYQRESQETITGTPVDKLGNISPAQVASLKAANIRTVEELASVSDEVLRNLGMGARNLQAEAKAMLEDESGKELEALKQQVRKLEALLNADANKEAFVQTKRTSAKKKKKKTATKQASKPDIKPDINLSDLPEPVIAQ